MNRLRDERQDTILPVLAKAGKIYFSEKLAIARVYKELSRNKSVVTHKDLILGLILKLESEETVLMQDIYRQALEFVVLHTPGDIRL